MTNANARAEPGSPRAFTFDRWRDGSAWETPAFGFHTGLPTPLTTVSLRAASAHAHATEFAESELIAVLLGVPAVTRHVSPRTPSTAATPPRCFRRKRPRRRHDPYRRDPAARKEATCLAAFRCRRVVRADDPFHTPRAAPHKATSGSVEALNLLDSGAGRCLPRAWPSLPRRSLGHHRPRHCPRRSSRCGRRPPLRPG